MLMQSKVRAVGLGCLALFCLLVGPIRAQTGADRRRETAEVVTEPAREEDLAQAATTAGITNEDVHNLLKDVADRVNTAIARATAARDAAQEVRDGVRDGVSALTGQLRSAIDGALADLQRIVGDQLGGAEFIAFTDGSNSCSATLCEPFREELLSLLIDFESNANTLFQVSGLNLLQLDFERTRSVIESLPGRVLFPLYRVLGTNDLVGSLSTVMDEISADLGPLGDIFVTDGMVAAADGSGTPICTVMTDSPGVFEAIVIRSTARAIGLKLVAKVFDALGETSASADAGIHGYVHITYEDNFPKKFAAIIEGLSDAQFYIAGAVEAKLEFCLMLQVRADAQQRQVELLDGQTQILNAILGNSDLNSDGTTDLEDYAAFREQLDAGAPRP